MGWLITLLCGPAALAGTYVVGVGSWPTIQEGVDAAPEGSVLFVEDGHYDEAIVIARDLVIEAEIAEPNIHLENTGDGPIVHVHDASVSLEGVRLGPRGSPGVLAERSTLTLVNTTFNGIFSEQGALHATDSDLSITGTQFTGNVSAADGGALWAESTSGLRTISIDGASFTGNGAFGNGGALWLRDVHLISSGLSLADNAATSGGGIYSDFSAGCSFESHPHGCVQLLGGDVDRNVASSDGGAARFIRSDVDISGTLFQDNIGFDGGAIAMEEGSFWIDENSNISGSIAVRKGGALALRETNSVILASSSNCSAADGGAVHIVGGEHHITTAFRENSAFDPIIPTGGAITAESATLYIEGAKFIDNTSPYAGAVLLREGDATVTKSSFQDNDGARAALHLEGGTLDSSQNVFCGNSGGCDP
jgi:hypothetical protein